MSDLPDFGLQYKYGSYRGPEPPQFCQSCGRPMVIGRRPSGFDPVTGEALYVRTARCSAPWWRKLSGLHHNAEQDEHGDWPWV